MLNKAEKETVTRFDESKVKHPFFETSTFEVLYPKHRTNYLKSIEEFASKACEKKNVKFEISESTCTLRVSTTEKTRDPFIIIKAYEMIQLLGKGVILEKAMQILEDGFASEILPVKLLCSTEKVFERRKHRVENPKILKSLELVTKTHVLVGSKSVCIVGNYRGVHEAKNIIIKCFENIHPAFELKKLIIKKKLERDGCEGDWERLLPEIKKTHSKKRKVEHHKEGDCNNANDCERQEDIQMQTGEFFSKPENVEEMKLKEEKKRKRDEIRQAKRTKHVVPEE